MMFRATTTIKQQKDGQTGVNIGAGALVLWFLEEISVTRDGDFLHFGQPFKAGGNNYLPKLPTLLGNFCKGVKIIHFSCEIVFGQLLWTFVNFHLVTLILSAIFELMTSQSFTSPLT